ncbi:MAG: restriction alleviation protein, Lar family [Desulfobulbaceae bacterium]|nr:restriction alleviation protein, Lar family [Desulfobulbaceae bacterium]
MESNDFLPCPFCGAKAHFAIDEDADDGSGFVACSGCPAHMYAENELEALISWNRRA